MKNITIAVSEKVARWARVWAAEHDTSVSQMLSNLLQEKMEESVIYKQSMSSFFAHEAKPLQNSKKEYPSRENLHDR